MSGSAVGKRPRTGNAPASSSTGGSTAGKRALTDGMQRARADGRFGALPDVVAQGMPCDEDALDVEGENGSTSECWLTPTMRNGLLIALNARVVDAHRNYKDSLGAKRLELLLSKTSGWGFAAELVFGLVSYNAVGAVVGALARMRKGAIRAITEAEFRGAQGGDGATSFVHEMVSRVNVEQVKDGLAHLGRASRSAVKERASGLAPHATSKVGFLALLGEAADQYTLSVRETLPAQLDDDGLLLLVESYDPQHHTDTMYLDAIDGLLARYDAQGVADVGTMVDNNPGRRGRMSEPETPYRLDAIRFTYRGRERVALVNQWLPTAEAPTDAHTIRSASWARWFDADLGPAAADAYEQRVGPVMTIDVEAGEVPPGWAIHVATWVATVPAEGE